MFKNMKIVFQNSCWLNRSSILTEAQYVPRPKHQVNFLTHDLALIQREQPAPVQLYDVIIDYSTITFWIKCLHFKTREEILRREK